MICKMDRIEVEAVPSQEEQGGAKAAKTATAATASERAAAELERFIETYSGNRLPAAARLAHELGISHATVSAAAALLRDRGLLSFGRGQRMRISGRAPAPNLMPFVASSEKLYALICDRIRAGSYRQAEALPKLGYFVIQEKVSSHTVLKVHRRLVKEELIHQQGKTWIVGPAPCEEARISVTSIPVVVLLQRIETSWGSLGRSERTEKFCQVFTTECDRHSLQLSLVLSEEEDRRSNAAAAGREQVLAHIRALGSRYMGTLIPCSTREIPELERWIRDLARLERPVVWFDRYGEPKPPRITSPWYSRCHYAAGKAEAEAFNFLTRLGHCRIGFMHMCGADWEKDRGDILETLAAVHPEGPELRRFTSPAEYFGAGPDYDQLRTRLRDLERSRPPLSVILDQIVTRHHAVAEAMTELGIRTEGVDRLSRLLDTFRLLEVIGYSRLHAITGLSEYICEMTYQTPALLEVLNTPGPTVLIAGNDFFARHIYIWLKAAGVRMPGDLSIISFDNYWMFEPVPVTTIDLGFGQLGYLALNVLQGLPVARDAAGNVCIKPAVVQRGSVADMRMRRMRQAV